MDNEKFAIAAHVHVLLRRKTGRVTDTEWMASNAEYAAEIVRFARAKAVEENMPELADWAAKLERVMGQPQKPVRRPLAESAAQVVRERVQATAVPGFADSRQPPASQPALLPDAATGFEESAYAESGFAESTMEPDGDPLRRRERRDPNSPRYVGGLR